MSKTMINVPLNRVEGDLEVRAQIDDGVVTDAWCSGTMYRGFERILAGRGPLDGLVITPRICGICSTAHLTAAARALDAITGTEPPPDALRIRNLALMAEHVQSDVRQTLLMYAVDFVNPAHRELELFDEAMRRYRPFEGDVAVDVIKETKKVLEIIAILGGQWPHSSFMVPGGVASLPTPGDLRQCAMLLDGYRRWYERRVLGCSLERWAQVQSWSHLEQWLDETDEHRQGELGFILRYARACGLDQMGKGYGSFVSFGSLDLPAGTAVTGGDDQQLTGAGLFRDGEILPFDQSEIAEHTAHSWFESSAGALHPMQGETKPYATGREGERYSWAKAPRVDGHPAETGPLAEMLVAGDPLFTDGLRRHGPSALLRQLARLVRPAKLLPAMATWVQETDADAELYVPPGEIADGEGMGLCHATRGALGHWVRIQDGAIEHYQIITPTAWNASPRDASDQRGPMEEALVGTPVRDPDNPIELGHVVRSFDPCLVCTVHAVGPAGSGQPLTMRLGG